jgi:hypothetical protein
VKLCVCVIIFLGLGSGSVGRRTNKQKEIFVIVGERVKHSQTAVVHQKDFEKETDEDRDDETKSYGK